MSLDNDRALVAESVNIAVQDASRRNIFFLDSGATSTTAVNDFGAFTIRPSPSNDVVGFDGSTTKIEKMFDMKGKLYDKNDALQAVITIANINHVPNSRFNLFSGSQATQKGWTLSITSDLALLTKGNSVLKFDRVMSSGTGCLYGARIDPICIK